MKIPIVTIIGKPNVGKSTFFNRLAGSRIAITTDIAGTTRDRIFHKVSHPEMDFFLVDTGGLEFEKKANIDIEANMQKQARIAIEESDLILFMVNGKEDLNTDDFMAAELIRKASTKKTVLLVVNKCDHQLSESDLAHMFQLGIGEPISISALHNTGIDKLINEIIKGLKERHFLTKDTDQYQKLLEEEEGQTHIALVGKPNVGKSSLINALLNEEKLIVSDVAGTTRDSTDSLIRHKGKDYNFIDTAGIKRPGKITKGIEKFSVLRTLSSIERCDVALLVIDSSEPISHQDQQIANTILKSYKGLVIVANKWDIPDNKETPAGEATKSLDQLKGGEGEDFKFQVPNSKFQKNQNPETEKTRIAQVTTSTSPEEQSKEVTKSADQLDEERGQGENPSQKEEQRRAKYIRQLQHRFPFLSWAPVVFTSAIEKKNLSKLFDQIDRIMEERKKRISTARLNHFIDHIVEQHQPTGTKRIAPKLFYVTQPEASPPHFVFFVNKKKYFHFSYLRYLENRLRETFGFSGTPIKMEYREKEQRYGKGANRKKD